MKSRNSQLGTRENTASSRQHALRLEVDSSIPEPRIDSESPTADDHHPVQQSEADKTSGLFVSESVNGTTEGERRDESHLLTAREVAELLQVPVSWVYERKRRRWTDKLPHVKLGKYLHFEERRVSESIRGLRCA
jgi:predicted DNA-binding transcriptional regulator AlpA